MIPHTTPVSALIASDNAIDVAGVDAGIDGHAVRTPTVVNIPSTRPTAAPTAVSVTASTRNCHRIVPRVAPSALRIPISRVRSVTEIIMIATTPTPPTSKPTVESEIPTRKKVPNNLLY